MDKLKCRLDDLRGLLSDPVAFKNIFRFAYDFAKVSTTSVSLDVGLLADCKRCAFE